MNEKSFNRNKYVLNKKDPFDLRAMNNRHQVKNNYH